MPFPDGLESKQNNDRRNYLILCNKTFHGKIVHEICDKKRIQWMVLINAQPFDILVFARLKLIRDFFGFLTEKN